MSKTIKKRLGFSLGVLGVALALIFGIRTIAARRSPAAAVAATASSAASQFAEPPAIVLSADSTIADRQLATAQARIKKSPAEPLGYCQLADGYMQKARETGDFGFNAKAEAAVDRALELTPGDYLATKMRAKLLLTYHRFGEALEAARRAQPLMPKDHDIYGVMTDALVELGDYPAAVQAAQAMMDLRPDTASYARVSYLRSLHGDARGAIEAMRVAVQAADPQNAESVAWCRVHLGHELLNVGDAAAAEREFDQALHAFPNYHLALAAKGKARAAAGDETGAIEFYKKAVGRVPLPEYAVALGDLYAARGRAREADEQYALVEFVERDAALGATYSRQLAVFWADHERQLDEALAIAERERAARKDIYTCDALAWCLFKKGRYKEARQAMNEALRLGTRDPLLFYHAGMIAEANGERAAATEHLRQALSVNPTLGVRQSAEARRALGQFKA